MIKKTLRVCLMLCMLFVLNYPFYASEGVSAILTYMFDDGGRSNYDNAYPILKKYNQVGVVYAIAERATNYYDNYATREQLIQMQDDGWEIGSHSVRHERLTELPRTYNDEILTAWEKVEGLQNTYKAHYSYNSLALLYIDGERLWGYKTSVEEVDSANVGYFFDNNNDYIYIHLKNNINPETVEIRAGSAQREIEQSYTDLTNMGFDVSSFVAPFLNFTDDLMEFIIPYYDCIISSRYDQSYNTLPIKNTNSTIKLNRMTSVNKNTSVAELTRIIDNEIKEDTWIILSLHRIYDEKSDEYGWSPEKLDQLAAYVQGTGVPVVTVRDGLAKYSLPQTPKLSIALGEGNLVSISWTDVSNADGYILYYAPWPNAEYIGQIDMGKETSIQFNPTGLAFYVAVVSYNNQGNSELSNIDFFHM